MTPLLKFSGEQRANSQSKEKCIHSAQTREHEDSEGGKTPLAWSLIAGEARGTGVMIRVEIWACKLLSF